MKTCSLKTTNWMKAEANASCELFFLSLVWTYTYPQTRVPPVSDSVPPFYRISALLSLHLWSWALYLSIYTCIYTLILKHDVVCYSTFTVFMFTSSESVVTWLLLAAAAQACRTPSTTKCSVSRYISAICSLYASPNTNLIASFNGSSISWQNKR